MTARIGKALSFSNVIACLALFIALGGTVYAAGKISGKQIKASSLPGNRIKPRTITANRIKPKALTGRQIKKRSLTGNEINQGTLTGVSAASLANVQYQVTTVPLAGNGTTATVGCPPDTHVIGGGTTLSNDEGGYVSDSGPSSQQTGWAATGFRYAPGTTMTVTAVCVVVGKPISTTSSGTVSSPPSTSPNYQPFG
ncbi:MAG: hypothetical protein ABW196_05505 [Solirubrobacterales bacterium]